jgi:sarcosine oxidase subunit beta
LLRLTIRMSREPEVIVLGAGILGCAFAWRLAASNLVRGKAILVIDPQPAASQATSRAAGLLSVARPAARSHWIPLVQKTLTIVDELNRTGQSVPLHRCGSLHLAASARTQALLTDYEATASSNDVSCHRVQPKKWAGRLPWLDLKRFSEGLWFPDEGYTDPYLLTSAYGAAARALGVRFSLGRPASLVENGSRVAVRIDRTVHTPTSVWVAAGAWSNSLLSQLGASAPQAAVRSQYWITERTPLANGAMPIVLAADLSLYARAELGAILFGLRETNGVAVASWQLPDDLAGFVFDADDVVGHTTLEACADLLNHWSPGLLSTGLRHYIAGPSCYTPDGDFLVGPVAGWDNLKLLAGCNGAGIAVSGGLAEAAVSYESGAANNSGPYLPTRFGPCDADAPAFLARCVAARAGKTSG